MSCDWLISFCPKCGNIETLGISDTCDYCGSPLKETEYIFDESVEHGDVKPEIRKAIFEKYIKDHPMYSEEAVKQREEKEYRNRLNMPSSYKSKESNKPKCPTCGSTNVKKLSTTSKVLGVGLLGLASKTVGKTYKCNKCGYYW